MNRIIPYLCLLVLNSSFIFPQEHLEYIIPRIIHQIWVGKNPIHPSCVKAMQTVRELHPKWEYKLWTDEDVDSFPWVNKDLFLKTKNPGAKSDIWRYEILNLYGGVYLDVDFIMLKPLDLIHQSYSFYSSFLVKDKNSKVVIANGVFGSTAHHPILQDIVHQITNIKHIKSGSEKSIMNKVGPDFFTKRVIKYINAHLWQRDIKIFDRHLFFPIPNTKWKSLQSLNYEIAPSDIEVIKQKNPFTIHLFTRSWIPSKQKP